MRDIMKFVRSIASIYLLALILAAMLTTLYWSEHLFVRWSSFGLIMLILVFLGVLEGGMRGEDDANYAKRMRKHSADRGEPLTPAELQRFYKPWKGFAAAALATSPILLLSLYMLITVDQDIPMMVTRLLLWPFSALFHTGNVGYSWYYLPMALVFPLCVGIGYFLGPTVLGNLLGKINLSAQKRRQARRKKRRG